MSLTAWLVIFIVVIVAFITSIVLLICLKFLKNSYYQPFTEDEEIKTVKTENSVNSSYFTSGEAQNYIRKYVICKTLYEKFVVCNYNRSYRDIIFFVVQYNKKHKVVGVISCRELYTTDTSKIIAVSNKTQYVNIIIGKVDNISFNSNVIRPVAFKKIRVYSLLKSIMLFSGLYIIKDIVIRVLATDYYERTFNNNAFNLILIGIIFILSLLSFFITNKAIRKKNARAAKGGAVEYDFL